MNRADDAELCKLKIVYLVKYNIERNKIFVLQSIQWTKKTSTLKQMIERMGFTIVCTVST